MTLEPNNFQMQWMLFQEKFTSIDKAFTEVKDRNQEMSNSLRDILNVLESVEKIHVSSDKLASEIRARIFNEMDKLANDRSDLEGLLSDIKTHLNDLSTMLENHLDANDQEREKVSKEIGSLSIMMERIDKSLAKDNGVATSLKEVQRDVRMMDGRNVVDGDKFGILSREWFIWHWKRGFSALITTLIVAIFFAIVVPMFILLAPKIDIVKVFGK